MERESDGVKKEEQFTFNTEDILTDPACEIIEVDHNGANENIAEQRTTFGLKIADFAIDPDSCTILPDNQEQPRAAENRIWTQPAQAPPIHQIPTQLHSTERNIQSAKLYQVRYSQHMEAYKDYCILTLTFGVSNRELKYFISSENFKREFAHNFQVRYVQSGDVFVFKYPNNLEFGVQHVKDYSSFLQFVSTGMNMVVNKNNIQMFAEFFKNSSPNALDLIPTFRYRFHQLAMAKFKPVLSDLGYEGIVVGTKDIERQKIGNWVRQKLLEAYPVTHSSQTVRNRATRTAYLIEQDTRRSCPGNMKLQCETIIKIKEIFLANMNKYLSLSNYPDMLYQVLFNSIPNEEPAGSSNNSTMNGFPEQASVVAQQSLAPSYDNNRLHSKIVITNNQVISNIPVIGGFPHPPGRAPQPVLVNSQAGTGHSNRDTATIVGNQSNKASAWTDTSADRISGILATYLQENTNKEPELIRNKNTESNVVGSIKKSLIANTEHQQAGHKTKVSNNLYCKGCNGCMASKSNGNVWMHKDFVQFKCTKCKKEVTCRVCGVRLSCFKDSSLKQKNDIIEKHLDSDEHLQKSKVYFFLTFYARMRDFDIKKHTNMEDFKFFLTALKAVTLTSPIAVMNCLSVIMSMADLSMIQYNQMYKHVDQLITATIPSFVCFCCNFLGFSDIEDVIVHTDSIEHRDKAAGKTQEHYLGCSKCAVVFHPESIHSHKGHVVVQSTAGPSNEIGLNNQKETNKRKYSEIEEESDPNFTIDEDNYGEDDTVEEYYSDAEEDVDIDIDIAPHQKIPKAEKRRSNFSHIVMQKKDLDFSNSDYPEACFEEEESESVPYFYFCLDCEKKSFDNSEFNNPRVPISINLAGHIKETNHTNFVPIDDRTKIQVKNISFNPEFNKLIIKKWKRLIKDGDITEVKYSTPRTCNKCNFVFEDAIDMFKHIKDFHVDREKINSE